ncbi:hypothetical protein VNO77_00347 [Canavalia gladiata]|uniref:Uncharacterized protein n=1 Tax=Canavalia gladiata TaxID=3824 RepID=A0AAN9MTS5_CANGL
MPRGKSMDKWWESEEKDRTHVFGQRRTRGQGMYPYTCLNQNFSSWYGEDVFCRRVEGLYVLRKGYLSLPRHPLTNNCPSKTVESSCRFGEDKNDVYDGKRKNGDVYVAYYERIERNKTEERVGDRCEGIVFMVTASSLGKLLVLSLPYTSLTTHSSFILFTCLRLSPHSTLHTCPHYWIPKLHFWIILHVYTNAPCLSSISH